MPDTVLITGGAGYVGSILCEHLLQAGFGVRVLDKMTFEPSLMHLCANPRFDFILGDVRDERLVAQAMSEADVIIPLAAIVGAPASKRDPWMTTAINRDAIRLITKLRSSLQLIIYPTTNSGYGAQSGDVHCTEDTPLEPISLYGVTKAEAEEDVLSSGNSITLRLATVFGMSPRMRLDLLVNHFTYAAVTDGYMVIFEKHFKRNYVHVRDVADCFVHCIQHQQTMIGRPFNVGLDSANLSKQELAEKIREHVPGFFIHYSEIGSDPDKRNYIVSNQRLREAGFEASRSIDDGIRELLKGYRMLGRGRFQNV
jgi:nucleoside-diphosphate-sugar epimerase